MSSLLTSALATLDDSLRIVESRLASLDAGLDVPREQFVQDVADVRRNAEAVQDLIRAQRADATWTDRPSLDRLVADLQNAEIDRKKELRLKKLLDLADELNAGTIAHRLRSRVTALEALRDPAVRELQAEAAKKDEARDLPGPEASAWLHWACGSHDDDPNFYDDLQKDFPALAEFVSEMEESYWQPGDAARNPALPRPDAASPSVLPQPSPLSDSAPAFAARYGHLSAAKASQAETNAHADATAAAAKQAPEAHATSSAADPKSNVSLLTTPLARVPDAVDSLPPTAVDASATPSLSTIDTAESATDVFALEPQRSRFHFSRSVLISVGVIAIVALVIVVIAAMSGSSTGKRSDGASSGMAGDSAKQTAPEAPVSDLELVGQIEQRLKSVAGSSIYVTVQHGTATLEGQVPSEEALAMAEDLTLQSSQIKIVRNRLQVGKSAAPRATNAPARPAPAAGQ